MNDLTTKEHKDMIHLLSWEVSKNVLDHLKFVYPNIFDMAPSTFPISLRNGIFNQIQSAIKCHTESDMKLWISRSEAHRKEMRRLSNLNKKIKRMKDDRQEQV